MWTDHHERLCWSQTTDQTGTQYYHSVTHTDTLSQYSCCAMLCQSINQSINQWINQSINQWINQWMNEWINQSINQCINQSINQSEWIVHLHYTVPCQRHSTCYEVYMCLWFTCDQWHSINVFIYLLTYMLQTDMSVCVSRPHLNCSLLAILNFSSHERS